MTSITLFCVFIATFELISQYFIVFLLLALNMLNVNRAKISMRKVVYFGLQSWTSIWRLLHSLPSWEVIITTRN